MDYDFRWGEEGSHPPVDDVHADHQRSPADIETAVHLHISRDPPQLPLANGIDTWSRLRSLAVVHMLCLPRSLCSSPFGLDGTLRI